MQANNCGLVKVNPLLRFAGNSVDTFSSPDILARIGFRGGGVGRARMSREGDVIRGGAARKSLL